PAHPRGAHARHRRRRQAGDHGPDPGPRERRGGGALHLVGDGRGGARLRPHRCAARPAQGGRAGRRPPGAGRLPHDRVRGVMATDRLRRIREHRLLWPVLTLVLLLAVNAAFNPGFWQLQWRDGHLYGSVIDILNRASPLVLVSLGMTLVIATRGLAI